MNKKIKNLVILTVFSIMISSIPSSVYADYGGNIDDGGYFKGEHEATQPGKGGSKGTGQGGGTKGSGGGGGGGSESEAPTPKFYHYSDGYSWSPVSRSSYSIAENPSAEIKTVTEKETRSFTEKDGIKYEWKIYYKARLEDSYSSTPIDEVTNTSTKRNYKVPKDGYYKMVQVPIAHYTKYKQDRSKLSFFHFLQ